MHEYEDLSPMSYQSTASSTKGFRPRPSRRVIRKSGAKNVALKHVPEQTIKYFSDFVTTVVDAQWRWVCLYFWASFMGCWLGYAIIWYVIALAHGDLDINPLSGERMGDGREPCIQGVFDFTGIFAYSVETQVSIGFGERYPSEECPEAIFVFTMQIVTGIMIDGCLAAIVFIKMSRPRRNIRGMRFSKRAVICQRDGIYCLIWRIHDICESYCIGTKLEAYWFQDKISTDGKKNAQFHHKLKIDQHERLLMNLPHTICHVIDESSPLYELSAKKLLDTRFEIVVAITGSSPSTGKISQARSSYINREIFWGQRFINIVSYDYEKQYYKIHDELFDCMEEVNTPLCSPKDYNDLQATHLQQEDDIKLTEPPPESEVYYYNDMSYHTNPYELHDIAERDPETDEIDESQFFGSEISRDTPALHRERSNLAGISDYSDYYAFIDETEEDWFVNELFLSQQLRKASSR